MKKIIALTALMIVACSGSAFAAALTSGSVSNAAQVIRGGSDATAAAASTNPLGRLSTGVRLGANYQTTCYALITKHDKGSKKIGTAHDSTAIFFVQEPAGALAAAPTACGNSAFATGWTSM
jgi:hypothetical protein